MESLEGHTNLGNLALEKGLVSNYQQIVNFSHG